jgi:butyrate kinase
MAVVLENRTDAIILTGGIAYNKIITDKIRQMVSFLAPVTVIPGEHEMEALAENGLRVLRGEKSAAY